MLNNSEQLHRLRELIVPVCQAHGVELVDARFVFEQGLVLRVLLERREGHMGSGISLADCQAVSRDLSTVLDVEGDVLPEGGYRLEVGSPGIERPLFSLEDYQRFCGREAKLRIEPPLDGQRRFSGTLLGVDDGDVRLGVEGRELRIPHARIAKAHLVATF